MERIKIIAEDLIGPYGFGFENLFANAIFRTNRERDEQLRKQKISSGMKKAKRERLKFLGLDLSLIHISEPTRPY